MDDDVRAKIKRAAQDRRRERVIHDQRYAMAVCDVRKTADVQHRQRWVGDRFAKYGLRIGLEGLVDLFIAGIGIDEDAFDAQLFQGEGEQVDRSAIDLGRADEAVPGLADVQDGKQSGGLTGSRSHCAYAAL